MASLAPISIWTDPRTFLTLFSIAIIPYTVLAITFILYSRSKPFRPRSSVVLVLGDFGRSPRMMYHAKSLVEHGWEAFVVAYGDTAPIASLTSAGAGAGPGTAAAQHAKSRSIEAIEVKKDPSEQLQSGQQTGRCHTHYLSPLSTILSLPLPWAVRAAIRLIHQCFAVLYILWVDIPCYTEYIIVQTPPAIPTLMLVQIAAMVSGSKVVVDWHNTGWSVLAQRLGRWRGIMWLAKSIERITGQNAYAHLFVSRAQKTELVSDFELHGKMEILHDRPPKHFRRTTSPEKAELFERLSDELDLPEGYDHTKAKVVISSTSWTPDEDFSPLLVALDMYEQCATTSSPLSPSPSSPSLPPLLVLITGKGPLLPAFLQSISSRAYSRIVVRCLFVPAADYPLLLGTADLGLSFHASTSGTDLPMKIVDMLGCGVPVLAKGYGTLAELVQEGREGRWFGSGDDLGGLLIEHMADTSKIDALRANIDNLKRWEDNWHEVVYQRVLRPSSSSSE